eukprot:TRINITY_DN1445_c0_g2_i2.p1 TRINITY_DN1445_c0_g2~~TRINITY_DN1445_c0_g2_i2.p1  ORF type:complete len:570 (+),score=180.44 TRINITY_DN1445_c0_g2_i2:177-1886(+)
MNTDQGRVIYEPKTEDLLPSVPLPAASHATFIKCCMCGTAIPPTAGNTCLQCLSSRTDIAEGITKQALLHLCKQCGRYLAPPWVTCESESKELLALCLKKIKGLNRVKVIDAAFIWTEPHSRKIKLKLTIQKEVRAQLVLQSTFTVELSVENMQCDECKKTWTPHTWNSAVQLRQRVNHKRTIYYLEQIILKHGMHSKTINVKEMPDGIDFFFANKSHAVIFNDFLHSQIISKVRQSKQLVSADLSSNNYNYKNTYYIEVAPVCREDLVFIPPKLQKELGGSSAICLISKMTSMIHLLDPIKRKTYSIDSESYWSHEFKSICTREHLSEFIIINIEPSDYKAARMATHTSRIDESANYSYADVELQRISDFGVNDNRVFATTHLGNVLKIDDRVLCYEIASLNCQEIEGLTKELPDLIIVKKKRMRKRANQKRIWKLKQIEKEPMEDTKVNKKLEERNEKDYEEFLEELEENPELRSKIDLYRDEKAIEELAHKMQALHVEEEKEPRAKPADTVKRPRKAKKPKKEERKPKEAKAADEDDWEDDDPAAVKLSELLSELTIADVQAKADK